MAYHDFDPWVHASQNIASGFIAANAARARHNEWMQEQAAMAPVRQAQVENYQANAARDRAETLKTEGETSRAANVDTELKGIMGRMEAGTVRNADGTVTLNDDATKAISRAIALLAKGSTDFGGGLEHGVKAMNYTAEQEKERANKVAMNDADNAARADLPVELNANTRLVNPKTGSVIGSGYGMLAQGGRLFEPGADNITLNPNPVAEGRPPNPSTAQGDSNRQRFVGQLLLSDLSQAQRQEMLRIYDMQTGGKPAYARTNAPAATTAPAASNPLTPPAGGNTPVAPPNAEQLIAEAKAAIAKGADPAAVKERLRSKYGIELQ